MEIILKYNHTIKYLLDSYQDINSLTDQFMKDYVRSNVILNSKKYLMKEFLEELYNITKNKTIITTIILLCCQSTFSIHYELVKMSYPQTNDYILCHNKSQININIEFSKEKCQLSLNTFFTHKNITTEKDASKYNTTMYIDYKSNLCKIKIEKNNCVD